VGLIQNPVRKCTYIALLLLFIGACIYVTCRQDVIFLVPFEGTKFLELVKIDIHYQNGNFLTYFLIFCLPDVLWYIALLLVQMPFYNRDTVNKILFHFAALLPFIFEFLQYFKVLPGTFDIVDVIFYLLTLFIFLIVWKKKLLISLCKSQ
jgi:hypothetical protein